MDAVTAEIVRVRKSARRTWTAAEAARELADGALELSRSGADTELKRFAVRAGVKAARDVARVRSESDLVSLIAAWVRSSISVSDEKRPVVMRIGSAMMSVRVPEEE